MSEKDTPSKLKSLPASSSTGAARRTRNRLAAADQALAKPDALPQAKIVEGETSKPSSSKGDGEPTGQQGQEEGRNLWKSRVLASYKGRNPKDSYTLLAKLGGSKASLQISEHYRANALKEAMIAVVDRMFDVFQNCAYELNKFALGSELELNWTRPFLAQENTKNWHHNQGEIETVFTGRISTRRWTMVVKGTLNHVSVYILPVDKMIGFALDNRQFKPYLRLEAYINELNVRWRISDHDLVHEMFLSIYKELFNVLIRFAKGGAREDESFDLGIIGVSNPEPEHDDDYIRERQRYYRQAFFEDIKEAGSRDQDVTTNCEESIIEIESETSKNEELSIDNEQEMEMEMESEWKQVPVKEQEEKGLDPEIAKNLHRMADQAIAERAKFTDSQNFREAPQAEKALPPTGPPEDVHHQAAVEQQNSQLTRAAGAHGMAAGQMNLPAALGILVLALERELEVVAKAGADAFAQRDLHRADAAIRFSARLNEYKQISQELLEYYRPKT